MDDGMVEFLSSVLTERSASESRPNVTLTFAQSLDAKIAGVDGKQLAISGKESMLMTHWMRTMHDGILVGIGTALNDDPQLNTRHLPDGGTNFPRPRPIIMDTNLRLSIDCKLLKNYRQGSGRRPWVLCSAAVQMSTKRKELETAGARVIPVQAAHKGLDIPSVLTSIRALGIKTLMVEGGAQVISSFMGSAEPGDSMILTIAPILVGRNGSAYDCPGVKAIETTRTAQIGRDTVVALKF